MTDPGPPHRDGIDGALAPIDVARIVNTGPFGYVTSGEREIIDGINATLCEWLGREADEIVGKQTFQDLLGPGDRIYYDTHVRPLLSMNHEVREIAVQLVRADGRRLHVLMNSLLRVDQNGHQRLETVVIDATERRRYEQELLRERQHAEGSEARLQVMYDVVSGLVGATSVAKIVDVVTERGEQSIAGASCSVWLFDATMRSVARANEPSGAPIPHRLAGDGPALVQLGNGELLVIADAQESAADYPILCEMLHRAGHRSAAVAPLLTDGVLHGVLSYGFDDCHSFDEAERRAVTTLAGQTEQALDRARSIDAERRSRDRVERLFQFSTDLSGALQVDDVLDAIASNSIDLLGAISVRLAVLAEDHTSVRFVRTKGQEADETTLDLQSNAIACAVIRTGEAVVLDTWDELRDQYPDTPWLGDESIGHAVALPLVRNRAVLGAWVLGYAAPGPPDPDDLTLLHLFAEQASQAMSRASLHQNEVAARARSDIRLAISESLNAAATTQEVAQAITTQGQTAFDASQLAVYMADVGHPDSLELIAHAGFDDGPPLHEVAALGADFVVAAGSGRLSPVHLDGSALDALRDGPFTGMHWEAAVLLPMAISGNMMGLIVVGFDDSNVVTPGTRAALAGLTAEAGAALGRARQYELEHEVAVTLQESLLPTDLGTLDGWTTSARYQPGSDHLVVGGDLFDVIRTSDDKLVVIVGDVVGHGLQAAAAMGQLRSAARALALVSSDPRAVLEGLEAFARITPGVMWATVVCVTIDPDGHGEYACAGHPYPVVLRNSGDTELLEGGRSALLGLADGPLQSDRFVMDLDDCLVLYTDGLVEYDAENIDAGIERLQTMLSNAHATDEPIEADNVVDSILHGSTSRDDIVVVCVTRVAAAAALPRAH